MATKERLHRMVEELSEEDVPAAAEALSAVRREHDPVGLALARAPLDPEPLSEAGLLALEEAEEDMRAGRVVSHEEVKRRFGIHDHLQPPDHHV